MESYGLGEVFAREQSLKRAELGGFRDAINVSAGFLKAFRLFWGRDGIAFAVHRRCTYRAFTAN